MRAWTAILTMGVLGVSLAGCDMPGSHQQQAAVAPVPPCNCRQASETMTAPPEPTEHLRRFAYVPHYYRRRHYAYVRPTHYRERYATYSEHYDVDRSQQSVDSYDYVSTSRVTRSESEYSQSQYSRGGYSVRAYAAAGSGGGAFVSSYGNGYGGAYANSYGDGYSGGRIVWVDGYGRGYFSNGPVTVAATMRGKRLATWHGYGVDCPDDGEPNGMIAP
jgi:hypothetical protein